MESDKNFNEYVAIIAIIPLYSLPFLSRSIFIQRFGSSFQIVEEFDEVFLFLRIIEYILAMMMAYDYGTKEHLFKDVTIHFTISIKELIDRDYFEDCYFIDTYWNQNDHDQPLNGLTASSM